MTGCVLCDTGFILSYGACIITCPDENYWKDTSSNIIECKKCHAFCLKCNSEKVDDCTECADGRYLH